MTAAEIDAFHRSIARVIREITTVNCKIVALPAGVTSEQGAATYTLAAATNTPPLEFVERERGGRAPVVALYPPQAYDTPTVWVSWYERWERGEAGDAEVRNISATFYWGIANRRRKQLLRAEWDTLEAQPQTAGQPHWQIDTELVGETYETTVGLLQPLTTSSSSLIELPSEESPSELVELTPTGLQEISLSRLHLGMAGWENATTYPGCWRRDLAADRTAISAWAARTLRHAADQFRLLSVVTV